MIQVSYCSHFIFSLKYFGVKNMMIPEFQSLEIIFLTLTLEKNSETLTDFPQVTQLDCNRARSDLGLGCIVLDSLQPLSSVIN